MNCIAQIQPFVQEYAETIADVLEIDVTILDEDCVRMGGTGPHKKNIGQPAPHGSFFRSVVQAGQPGIIQGIKNEAACRDCASVEECRELAAIGYPILKRGKPVGVIGVIAFSVEQRERLLNSAEKLLGFLRHMSNLLEGKLLLMEANERLQQQVQQAMDAAQKTYSFGMMIGRNRPFVEVLQKAERVAATASTILIRGESGTGKELLARAIHEASGRREKPMIVVNCPSIPDSLLESELFGYEGGAFTGANRQGKAGKFELAEGGTVFLDEIGDLPLTLQPKLLRAIQEKTVERLGGGKPVPVNVRVIAATNRDLEAMVREGKFRPDLYYRLNVIPLVIPPLRERREDIGLYFEYFLEKYAQHFRKGRLTVAAGLIERLSRFDWPGNVRQLENVAEYIAAMAHEPEVTVFDLPDSLREGITETEPAMTEGPGLQEQLDAMEKIILTRLVPPEATLKDKIRAAEALKISIATLYRRLEKHGMTVSYQK